MAPPTLESPVTTAESPPPKSSPAIRNRPPQDFQTEQVLTVSGGHFIHDSFSAFVAPLLVQIRDILGTNYATTGSLAIFIQLPSLLNPFIGYLADRVSLRYFIILAPALTATICSSLGLTSSYLTLALLLFAAGISVAAFHAPAPAMIARLAGPRVGTGMSVFMASGELGRAVGPLLVATGIAWWGLDGLWRLSVIGWICSVVLYFRLRTISARPGDRQISFQEAWPQIKRVFPVIIWINVTKACLVVALTTYLPLYMEDLRVDSFLLAAGALSLLEAAGVIGALFTGTVSDRIGRGRMLGILLVLAPILMALFVYAPLWAVVPLLILLGLTAISPTPVLLAMIQDYFPQNRALANGLLLATNFLARAGALLIVGWMGDYFGLAQSFLLSGGIALIALPALFFLPTVDDPSQPTPA